MCRCLHIWKATSSGTAGHKAELDLTAFDWIFKIHDESFYSLHSLTASQLHSFTCSSLPDTVRSSRPVRPVVVHLTAALALASSSRHTSAAYTSNPPTTLSHPRLVKSLRPMGCPISLSIF